MKDLRRQCPNPTKLQLDKVAIFLDNRENMNGYCQDYSKHKKGVNWDTMQRDWKLMRTMYLDREKLYADTTC